jgi:hypothetical protein
LSRSNGNQASGTLLLCLLPVRNAEADLPGFLESVGRFCDGVVALDDGSTDATYDILAASPLVLKILRNPRREDYRAWDDAENRNRLLTAAAEFQPQWVISIDADERLDAVDAESLRRFLETDALPGFAFGFRHVPMRGDSQHFWPHYQWVYRLFSYRRGQRFPSQKLHFIPVPTSIPRDRWLKTTLRIQHLGGMTPERRVARFEKYLEADPDRTYQTSYRNLLQAPAEGDLRRWQSRPRNMPVLIADEQLAPEQLLDGATPALSAIIIAQNDEATIARSVSSVVNQEMPEPFEVIVVTSGADRTADIVDQLFPAPVVTHIALDTPALPGEARNAGLPDRTLNCCPAVSPRGCGRTGAVTPWSPASPRTATRPGPGGHHTFSIMPKDCRDTRRRSWMDRRRIAHTRGCPCLKSGAFRRACAPARIPPRTGRSCAAGMWRSEIPRSGSCTAAPAARPAS